MKAPKILLEVIFEHPNRRVTYDIDIKCNGEWRSFSGLMGSIKFPVAEWLNNPTDVIVSSNAVPERCFISFFDKQPAARYSKERQRRDYKTGRFVRTYDPMDNFGRFHLTAVYKQPLVKRLLMALK